MPRPVGHHFNPKKHSFFGNAPDLPLDPLSKGHKKEKVSNFADFSICSEIGS
jgi:hypothetical protein